MGTRRMLRSRRRRRGNRGPRPGSTADGPAGGPRPLRWVEDRILPLKGLDPAAQQQRVTTWWTGLDRLQRFIFLKLVTGELRVGVSQRSWSARSPRPPTCRPRRSRLASWASGRPHLSGIPRSLPRANRRRSLAPLPVLPGVAPRRSHRRARRPERLAGRVEVGRHPRPARRRDGVLHLWSRGEELITDRFPEIVAAASRLPDGTVLDGEVLALRDERPLPFSAPAAADRTQEAGRSARAHGPGRVHDLRHPRGSTARTFAVCLRRSGGRGSKSCSQARHGVLRASPLVGSDRGTTLAALRGESRARGVEGLMLKRLDVGLRRRTEARRLVEVEDRSVHDRRGADLRAARQRHAGPASFTDYTFGVWHQGELVPIAKAYSGLIERRDRRSRPLDPAAHVENASARSGTSSPSWCSSWASRASRDRRGTARASPSASRGCCDGEPTRKPKTPTRWSPSRSS